MNNIKACLSSKKMDWETPQDFFDKLNKEFNFTLDPCATKETAKCDKFYTKEINGLDKDWGGRLFSVILLTVGKLKIGSKNVVKRVIRQIQK